MQIVKTCKNIFTMGDLLEPEVPVLNADTNTEIDMMKCKPIEIKSAEAEHDKDVHDADLIEFVKKDNTNLTSKDSISQSSRVSVKSVTWNNFNSVEPETVINQKVNLYAEDKGPKIYHPKANLVTPAIIPKILPDAFKFLPIQGGPELNKSLKEFQTEKIRDFLGCDLDDEEFNKLVNYCSPENLQTGFELKMTTNYPQLGLFTPPSPEVESQLCVVKKHRLRMEKDHKNLYPKKLKYRGVRVMPMSQEDDQEVETDDDVILEPGKDLLFRVRVYRPFPYNPRGRQIRPRHSLFMCDIVLVGSQKLTALRDRIVCANDVSIRVDVSQNPLDLPDTTAKDVFPSGFLFINNAFYVDTREGCQDRSITIRDWAVKQGYGNFPSHDMGSVRIDDLVVKLGHPEVYVHQGNCEHLFTFSELRVVGAADGRARARFPRHCAVSQLQTLYCTTCAEFGAKWIVNECPRVPFEPAFFCDKCLKFYMYKDGQKIGDFKAYSYRGNEINLLKPHS